MNLKTTMQHKMDAVLGSLGRVPELANYLDVTMLLGRDVYSILPALLILTITPIYLSAAFRNRRCPRYGKILWTKIVTVFFTLFVEVANIILFSTSPDIRSKTTVAAALFSGASSLCLALLLYAEKLYSFRPPGFLSLGLAVSILFDITKARSYLEHPAFQVASRLSTALYLLKAFLLLTEEAGKALAIRSLQPKRHRNGHLWARNLFLWLNATLVLGFRNVLKVNDLLDMGPKFNSELLYQQFKPTWEKSSKKGNYALAKACVRALPWDFIAVFIPQFFYIGFTLAQPYLVRVTVAAVEEDNLTDEVVRYLIRTTIIIYAGKALSRAGFEHLNYRLITLLRGTLISAIYDKTLQLGHDQLKDSAAVTLMSTDINGLQMALLKFHEIWGRLVELAIGTYILSNAIGLASVLLMLPVVLLAITSVSLTKGMALTRRSWNEKIEERVSATSYILTQLKSIKISGFAPIMADYLQSKRLGEILTSRQERLLRVGLHASQNFVETMSPVVVVGGGIFWTKNGNDLSRSDLFNTLAVIAVVSVPLARALINVPAFFGGLICLTRIQEFLLIESPPLATNDDGATKDVADRKGKAPVRRKRQVYLAVEVDNAVITRPGKDEPMLRNIKLSVRQGQIAMIYGPVGCGKTSLLKAILGELEVTGGFIGVDRRKIAYCDQNPWLQNHSIRDNIIAQNEYNYARYRAVLHACALNEDIAQLADGDHTLVGSSGAALSGGQRQRVALARALYHSADLVVLDDVLSALDATTAKTILFRLLGKGGMLRQFACSVVMTTNILEDLPAADVIYAITAGGEVRRAANVSQFVKDAFVKQSEKDRERQPPPDKNVNVQTDIPPVPDWAFFAERHDDLTTRQRGDLSLYDYYLRNMGYDWLALFFFVTLITGIWSRLPLLFVQYWMEQGPDSSTYFGIFALISAASIALMTLMVGMFYLYMVPTASIKMHKTLVNTVMRMTLSFISVTDASSILHRFSQDMSMIAQLLPVSFIEVVYITVSAVTTICMISSAASYSSVIVPAFGILLYCIQYFYLRTSRQLRLLDMEAKVPLFKHFTETASGIEHIRAFKWQENFLWLNYGLLDYSQKPYYYFFCIQRWLSLVLDMVTCLLAVITVSLALHNSVSPTTIGISMVNLVALGKLLTDIMESWVELETCLGAVARTREFNQKSLLERKCRVRKLPDYWPTAGNVEFRNVTASYNLKSTGNQPVLKNVSFKIKPGEKVSIIGRTGSGKSSLILSLLNLLNHTGKILIDGTNIKRVPVDFLRDRITTVPQDGVELDASVRLNLDPYDDPDSSNRLADETLQENLTTVGLWDVVKQRGGLDVPLSKMSFSPGQKQLLCLGRAILCREYKQSRIVLIDEATSSVDVETDKRIQAVIAKEFGAATVISITHRHHGVEHSDTVLEMRDGRVTHSLDRKTKVVRKLV